MFNFSEVARNTLILSEQPEAAHIWKLMSFLVLLMTLTLNQPHSRTPRLDKSQDLTQFSQRATLYISLSLKLWQKTLVVPDH